MKTNKKNDEEIKDKKVCSVTPQEVVSVNTEEIWDKFSQTRKSTYNQREIEWRDKLADERIDYKYTENQDENNINIKPEISKFNIPSDEWIPYAVNIYAATGTASESFGRLLLSQAASASIPAKSHLAGDSGDLLTGIQEALIAMNPKDPIEGMLCSRIVTLHNNYMSFLNKVASTESLEVRERYINMATKIMRIANETTITLTQYRRKGEQKVSVTHNYQQVNVSSGGKAVVGDIKAGGGYNGKN